MDTPIFWTAFWKISGLVLAGPDFAGGQDSAEVIQNIQPFQGGLNQFPFGRCCDAHLHLPPLQLRQTFDYSVLQRCLMPVKVKHLGSHFGDDGFLVIGNTVALPEMAGRLLQAQRLHTFPADPRQG